MESRFAFEGFLDIETLPTADSEVISLIDSEIAPPKTHKRAETIAAWMQNEKPAVLEELVAKTALDGTYGRIVAIGCAVDDGEVKVWMGDDEAKLIAAFFDDVAKLESVEQPGAGTYHAEVTWIGHNVRSFDLRFLWQRAVIHGIKMPGSLRLAALSRTWDRSVADTMVMWNPERDRRISLDKLCRALRLPCPKTDMDGSKVAAAWAAGELARIEAYVRDDVAAVRACFRRMTFAQVP